MRVLCWIIHFKISLIAQTAAAKTGSATRIVAFVLVAGQALIVAKKRARSPAKTEVHVLETNASVLLASWASTAVSLPVHRVAQTTASASTDIVLASRDSRGWPAN